MSTNIYAKIINKERQSDGTLIVTGVATDDTLDVDAQICDPGWLETAMPAWFKFGNIREQHSNIAAGVATKYEQDGSRHLVTAHVVDPSSVLKVESGVLKGFSIGIRNPRVAKDKAAPGGRIVDGEIVEVSLVDRPANPSCMLELAKSTGGVLRQVENLIQKAGVMERCKVCKIAHEPDEMKDGMCEGCAAKAEESASESSAAEVTAEESNEGTAMAAEPEESSQAEGEESSQARGEESSRPGGVAGVAGKEDMDDIRATLARIVELLAESGKAITEESSEETAKSIKLLDERLVKVEKSASRSAPVRAIVKAAVVESKADKAAEYRAKAAAASDPALASGYLLLASEVDN